MKRQWKFIVVLVLGAIGLITDNVLHIPGIAEVLFDIAGAYISFSLGKEMFGDLKEGHWGIDVLALIAVISMMITRDYWAEWMILVMSTGGESLEDYATGQANRELRALLDKNPRVAGKLVDGKVVEVKVDDLQI
ncbi:MAG: heavy metal translocating P-type ATPase, partial [Lactobacillus delbrueckii]